jgi:ubiquinone/menaquinone biosynthesis C-methylase UbiE
MLTDNLSSSKNIFDLHYQEYDAWFDENHYVYLSELLALKRVIPNSKKGIEIGIGTGRFAQMLEIPFGIDISFPMLKIARERGCSVALADAARLPFKTNQFDFALLMFC